jgi:hypothetical protein
MESKNTIEWSNIPELEPCTLSTQITITRPPGKYYFRAGIKDLAGNFAFTKPTPVVVPMNISFTINTPPNWHIYIDHKENLLKPRSSFFSSVNVIHNLTLTKDDIRLILAGNFVKPAFILQIDDNSIHGFYKGGDYYFGLDPTILSRLENYFNISRTILFFPKQSESLIYCPKHNPLSCAPTEWRVCAKIRCKALSSIAEGKFWEIDSFSSYSTAKLETREVPLRWAFLIIIPLILVVIIGSSVLLYGRMFGGKVIVTRGFTRDGKFLKVGIKINNKTRSPCRDVAIRMTYPEAFEIDDRDLMGKNYLNLGDIEAGTYQSAIVKLRPTRCVRGIFAGSVSYKDNFGLIKTIPIKPLEISSVCPFLEKYVIKKDTFPSLDKNWNKAHIDPRKFIHFKYPEDKKCILHTATLIEAQCSEIYEVYRVYNDNEIEIGYAGKGKFSGKRLYIIFKLSMDGIDIYCTGDSDEMVTGFVSEMSTTVSNGLEEVYNNIIEVEGYAKTIRVDKTGFLESIESFTGKIYYFETKAEITGAIKIRGYPYKFSGYDYIDVFMIRSPQSIPALKKGPEIYLPTGIGLLDAVINGGIPQKGLTCISGPMQIGAQLLVTSLQKKYGSIGLIYDELRLEGKFVPINIRKDLSILAKPTDLSKVKKIFNISTGKIVYNAITSKLRSLLFRKVNIVVCDCFSSLNRLDSNELIYLLKSLKMFCKKKGLTLIVLFSDKPKIRLESAVDLHIQFRAIEDEIHNLVYQFICSTPSEILQAWVSYTPEEGQFKFKLPVNKK